MAASHAQLGRRYAAYMVALFLTGTALIATGRFIQNGGTPK